MARSNAKIVAGDFTETMLQIARRKAKAVEYTNIKFVRGNAAELPFGANEFDVVISLNFLYLFPSVPRQEAFTKEMHRVLQPGGMLVIELINLYQGVFIGLARKRFGWDLGFNAPGYVRRVLCPEFRITRVVGGHLPRMWRLPYPLSKLSSEACRFVAILTKDHPWNYIAYNLFVQAIKS